MAGLLPAGTATVAGTSGADIVAAHAANERGRATAAKTGFNSVFMSFLLWWDTGRHTCASARQAYAGFTGGWRFWMSSRWSMRMSVARASASAMTDTGDAGARENVALDEVHRSARRLVALAGGPWCRRRCLIQAAAAHSSSQRHFPATIR